ncbi:MAG: hypothetical protein H0V89_08875 [Deltaproteobacteria bacterium]|nr:hypothetical protein [Deltaproteobacteria bacterium]
MTALVISAGRGPTEVRTFVRLLSDRAGHLGAALPRGRLYVGGGVLRIVR